MGIYPRLGGLCLPFGAGPDRRTGTGPARCPDPPPQPWRHEALTADDLVLGAAARHAQQFVEARGWSRTTLRGVPDGLATVLRDLPGGVRVPMSEVRDRPHKDMSRPRLAEVPSDLGLLHDDSTTAVRALIERVTSELAPGFAVPARRWLLVLPDGGPRAEPRSEATIYAYSAAARPILQEWARTYDHLREVTTSDIYPVLKPRSGYPRRKTADALRSLFRFAKRNGLVFTDPAAGVGIPPIDLCMCVGSGALVFPAVCGAVCSASTASSRLRGRSSG